MTSAPASPSKKSKKGKEKEAQVSRSLAGRRLSKRGSECIKCQSNLHHLCESSKADEEQLIWRQEQLLTPFCFLSLFSRSPTAFLMGLRKLLPRVTILPLLVPLLPLPLLPAPAPPPRPKPS